MISVMSYYEILMHANDVINDRMYRHNINGVKPYIPPPVSSGRGGAYM